MKYSKMQQVRKELEDRAAGDPAFAKFYEDAKEIAASVAGGLHNMPEPLRLCGYSGIHFLWPFSMATFDGNTLSTLVILAHDKCIRASISPCMRNLDIQLFPRERDGSISRHHPTIEDAIKLMRGSHA